MFRMPSPNSKQRKNVNLLSKLCNNGLAICHSIKINNDQLHLKYENTDVKFICADTSQTSYVTMDSISNKWMYNMQKLPIDSMLENIDLNCNIYNSSKISLKNRDRIVLISCGLMVPNIDQPNGNFMSLFLSSNKSDDMTPSIIDNCVHKQVYLLITNNGSTFNCQLISNGYVISNLTNVKNSTDIGLNYYDITNQIPHEINFSYDNCSNTNKDGISILMIPVIISKNPVTNFIKICDDLTRQLYLINGHYIKDQTEIKQNEMNYVKAKIHYDLDNKIKIKNEIKNEIKNLASSFVDMNETPYVR